MDPLPARAAGSMGRLNGRESQGPMDLSSRFRALKRLLCGFGIAGSREDGDCGRLGSKKGWGDDGAWLPAELAAVGMPSAAVCAPWSVLACASFQEAAADGRIAGAGQRRPRHRSGHLHKTGADPGHMAGPTAGRKRVSVSQLCGGRARAGSVRLAAALSDGGACGVAAVCRRPVKDPPRQFGERAFTGFPWAPMFRSAGLQGGMSR